MSAYGSEEALEYIKWFMANSDVVVRSWEMIVDRDMAEVVDPYGESRFTPGATRYRVNLELDAYPHGDATYPGDLPVQGLPPSTKALP